MGDISEVAAVTGHPWKRSQGESLAHALLKFKNNKIGALHCHVNVIPMEEIPFFQIFGTKVSNISIDQLNTTNHRER